MKAYLITTAGVFGLLVVVHVWRAIVESMAPAREPFFIIVTLLSAVLCGWGLSLLRASDGRQA